MHIRNIFWLAPAAFLCSCNWGVPHSSKPDITKDTLVYNYKIIKDRASDCGNKADSACSVAKITYPLFSSQATLNDTIASRLLNSYFTGKVPDNNLQQQADNFIKAYETDTTRKTDHTDSVIYTLESNAAVIRQDSSLVTVQIDRYVYDGGAHGSDYTSFVNWDSKANKKIGLDDILKPGFHEQLTAIAQKIFRTDEKLGENAPLTNYFFKDAKFSVNNNFLITPIGLRFLYNEYEIKPYSDGQTELLIPYVQIKSLLKAHTVISQYTKR